MASFASFASLAWFAATVVVASPAHAQSFPTRDELALIEALARDGFADVARARLDALAARLAPAELPLVEVTAARVARGAAAQAATPAERAELLRAAAAALGKALAPSAGAPPPPEALRPELVATLRDLARVLAVDAAEDPAARAGAAEALREARRQLEALFNERQERLRLAAPRDPAGAALQAATVDAWLPILDAARLCFDEAGLLAANDPQHAGRLRSAREQADQFAWKVGPLSVRSLDARLLAARAAFELGDFDECAARMQALFDDAETLAAADAWPELRAAAAQTWLDALASATAAGDDHERARARTELRTTLPRLEALGARGAPFLLAADEFTAALALPAAADPAAAAERTVRLQSALIWLRAIGPADPDRDRALLLTARCTLALAAAGQATAAEALAPLDALAALAASHPAANRARAQVREQLLLEAEFDRGQVLQALGRGDAALAHWRPLAQSLVDRLKRTRSVADRALLRDVALALGGELALHDGRDVATTGAGTRAEAAELWAALAAGGPPDDPATLADWREAAFYSIWFLPDDATEVARRRLAELDAALASQPQSGDATWQRRVGELRARWR